ncbi:MAG: hypothetical protein U0821_23705 [Chloroflexota bacterium]
MFDPLGDSRPRHARLAVLVLMALLLASDLSHFTGQFNAPSVGTALAAPRHPEKDRDRKAGLDNGNGNGNGNSNRNDNEDEEEPAPYIPPAKALPEPRPPAVCSTPGQDMAFRSSGGRVTVRVFATMPRSVRFAVQLPVDLGAGEPPGPVVGDLRLLLAAGTCEGEVLTALPAEVNLAINYADADIVGMDESRLGLAFFDVDRQRWVAVAKQANDPVNNIVAATISTPGLYTVYQREPTR